MKKHSKSRMLSGLSSNRKILSHVSTPFFHTYLLAAAAVLLLAVFAYCLRRRKSYSAGASIPCHTPEIQPLLLQPHHQQPKWILESELRHEPEESNSVADVGVSDTEAETKILLHFLLSLREEKKKQAAKLEEVLNFLNEDIKELERSNPFETDSLFPLAQMNNTEVGSISLNLKDSSNSDISRSIRRSFVDEERFMSNINRLENAYFSARFQVLPKEASSVSSNDENVMENRWRLPNVDNVNKEPRRSQSSVGCLESFYEGLCKFASNSKFEECGRLRNSDPFNSSSNLIADLSFDPDEHYIAAAGVSKKIKIFDLSAISSNSFDIQYPVVEMSNNSKLSCVCWNTCIRNHLASTDYQGVVQMWDAGTGQLLSEYMEHRKRAWSVHFSASDPTMFASGSDDCSVKLWNISEARIKHFHNKSLLIQYIGCDYTI
ncbi:hypothetical protein Fmac_010590 [Flemingia macrophylla]|uniref:Uncharacterized protein n=1 Tax=Flemingia macrophylla TaxID=520843 RepID=A0ABD1MK04_9FABA